MLAQRFLRIANLAFARQEHQNIARPFRRKLVDGVQQQGGDVRFVVGIRRFFPRCRRLCR